MAKSSMEMRVVFNRVPQVTEETLAKTEELVKSVREGIAEEARRNAPVGTGDEGDPHPGELRDSIHVEDEKVVADSDHANFVEHGTIFMAPEPFFAPACQKGKELLRAGLRGLIG
jgi:HK97 gp10 family phage protein